MLSDNGQGHRTSLGGRPQIQVSQDTYGERLLGWVIQTTSLLIDMKCIGAS